MPQRFDDGAPLAMRPQGAAGRAFGVVMEAMNAPTYAFALELLDLAPTSDVLEIGFGTGRMIELLAARTTGKVAGVDPTPTMVEVAQARGAIRRAGARIELRLGTDQDLDWPEASFNRIVAIHAFQFWPAPEASVRLIRALLRPGGRLVLVLRRHDRGAPEWLRNPISRSGDEVGGAAELLAATGLRAEVVRRSNMVAVIGDQPLATAASTAR